MAVEWTPEEINYLIDNYSNNCPDDLIKGLREINPEGYRQTRHINYQAHKLGLKKNNNYLNESKYKNRTTYIDKDSIQYLDIKNGYKYVLGDNN